MYVKILNCSVRLMARDTRFSSMLCGMQNVLL